MARKALVLLILFAPGAVFYWFATRVPPIDSIVVLPFAGTGEGALLTRTIHEQLSRRLPGLRVPPPGTGLSRRNDRYDLKQIERDLKVRAALAGRIEMEAGQATVPVELVLIRENRRIWHKRYTAPQGGMGALAAEIAEDLAKKLGR